MIRTRLVREPLLPHLAMACLLAGLKFGRLLRLHQSEMDEWIEGQGEDLEDIAVAPDEPPTISNPIDPPYPSTYSHTSLGRVG